MGEHNKLKMADLRQLLETMGLTNVKTYIADLPSQEGIAELHSFKNGDEFQIKDKEVYLLLRQSIRKSKLASHLGK
ncbi:DUF1697 domain-containing protein [Virgibacillus ndiopensis]|uniref:DUF1697 domain-containing protein n=1 Tax=Virgibacillus ndiopensis TaxID=2004408 RepID=UPI003CCBFD0E